MYLGTAGKLGFDVDERAAKAKIFVRVVEDRSDVAAVYDCSATVQTKYPNDVRTYRAIGLLAISPQLHVPCAGSPCNKVMAGEGCLAAGKASALLHPTNAPGLRRGVRSRQLECGMLEMEQNRCKDEDWSQYGA